jgi:hypothetical protein
MLYFIIIPTFQKNENGNCKKALSKIRKGCKKGSQLTVNHTPLLSNFEKGCKKGSQL